MTFLQKLSLLLCLGVFLSPLGYAKERDDRTPDTVESDIALDDNVTVFQNPNEEAPPPQRPKVSQKEPADFSVKTTHIGGAKRAISRNIQLLNPPHKSTYTPGMITFSWKYATAPKKVPTVLLRIERLDGKKKYTFKTRHDKRQLDLAPGEYKWQVALDKPSQESRWRLFKVLSMKSDSFNKLYDGPTPQASSHGKKGKSDSLANVNVPDDDEEEEIVEVDDTTSSEQRVPTSLPPLKVPSWVNKGAGNSVPKE